MRSSGVRRPTGLARWLPILAWGRGYGRAAFASDLLAAVIVTVMLIPQSLAYALLADLPPVVGLYASIVPLVVYAFFGSSRTLAVGPVAVISLMTATAIGKVAGGDPARAVEAALVLALLSGLILIAMGAARLGFLANFLSHPVIAGFIAASAIVITASQIKHLLGIPGSGDTLPAIAGDLARHAADVNATTAALGGAALAFLFVVRLRLKSWLAALSVRPVTADILVKAGPIVAVALAVAAVAAGDLGTAGVKTVGAVPPGLPPLTLPPFSPALWLDLLPSALLIGLVGFVESVSVARTLAARRRERVDADQELIALGAANVAAAVSAGYPVSGGFARSVVNFDAGAATPLAGALTAVGIAATTAFATPLFRDLPNAVLAATIIVAVLSLVDVGAIRRTLRYSKADFTATAVTILAVLSIGVEIGIIAGVVVSLVLHLWRTSRPHMAVIGQVPGTEHFRNVERHRVVTSPTVVAVRVDESLYFANTRYLEDRLLDIVATRPETRDLVLLCSAINFIDASALESLEAIVERSAAAGVRFHLAEVKGPVMDRLKRSTFLTHLTGSVFLSQFAAMAALDPATTARASAPVVDAPGP